MGESRATPFRSVTSARFFFCASWLERPVKAPNTLTAISVEIGKWARFLARGGRLEDSKRLVEVDRLGPSVFRLPEFCNKRWCDAECGDRLTTEKYFRKDFLQDRFLSLRPLHRHAARALFLQNGLARTRLQQQPTRHAQLDCGSSKRRKNMRQS